MKFKSEDYLKEYKENMRGGEGTVLIKHFASPDQCPPNCRLMATIEVEPGCSIGEHEHVSEAEIFYCIEGEGTIIDDGRKLPFSSGDSHCCYSGNKHSVINTGTITMKMVAVIISGQPQIPRRSIMVVDDSKVNILKAEYILKQNGYSTVSATSGEECISKLKYVKPDLILLDIAMPQMDGFEVIDKIKADENTKDIPVVFVTADHKLDAVLKANQEHAAGYITKPFNEEQLLSYVGKALG